MRKSEDGGCSGDASKSNSDKKKRVRYQNSDLPPGLQAKYLNQLIPHLKKCLATLEPFENPDTALVQNLMNQYFPHYLDEYRVQDGDVYVELVCFFISC